MINKSPRPKGFDYKNPDPPETRCPLCNPYGYNRTGLQPIAPIGNSTTGYYGVRCVCDNGVIRGDK